MQGASPLASPGLGGARHGSNLRSRHPAGAYPRRWRLDQPLRCLTGGLPGGVPAYPAVSLLCFPHPPAPPFPAGRGRPRLFHARGFAPCIPGAGWGAARAEPAEQAPGGGVPPALAARPAVAVPDGGLPGGVPAYPAVSLLCFPHPPAPRSQSALPGGKGEIFSFLMQGASPLAFPGLGGARHGLNLRSRHQAGGVPPALVARPAVAVPDGGLPSLPPAAPAVSLLCFPHPPARARRALFPAGRGRL